MIGSTNLSLPILGIRTLDIGLSTFQQQLYWLQSHTIQHGWTLLGHLLDSSLCILVVVAFVTFTSLSAFQYNLFLHFWSIWRALMLLNNLTAQSVIYGMNTFHIISCLALLFGSLNTWKTVWSPFFHSWRVPSNELSKKGMKSEFQEYERILSNLNKRFSLESSVHQVGRSAAWYTFETHLKAIKSKKGALKRHLIFLMPTLNQSVIVADTG